MLDAKYEAKLEFLSWREGDENKNLLWGGVGVFSETVLTVMAL